MGTPLGPKYIPYTYMDPLGNRNAFLALFFFFRLTVLGQWCYLLFEVQATITTVMIRMLVTVMVRVMVVMAIVVGVMVMVVIITAVLARATLFWGQPGKFRF